MASVSGLRLAANTKPLVRQTVTGSADKLDTPRRLGIGAAACEQPNGRPSRPRDASEPQSNAEGLAGVDPGAAHVAFHIGGPQESVPLVGASRNETQEVLGDKYEAEAIDQCSVRARVDEDASMTKNPGGLGNHGAGIVDVLEDLHAYHRVERGICERKLLACPPNEHQVRSRDGTVVLPSLQGAKRRVERHDGESGVVERFGEQASSRTEVKRALGARAELVAEHPNDERDAYRGEQYAESMEDPRLVPPCRRKPVIQIALVGRTPERTHRASTVAPFRGFP